MKKSMNNRFSQKIRCFIKTVDRTEVIVAFKISKFNSSLKDSSPGYESRLTHFSLILYYQFHLQRGFRVSWKSCLNSCSHR